MNATELPFLDRAAELDRLRRLLNRGKSVLLTGPPGSGKSALLARLQTEKLRRALLTGPGTLDPAAWLRCLLAALDAPPRRSAGANRRLLFEALKSGDYVVALDPAKFLSRAFYELLRDLERGTATPLVLAAHSEHMEDVGQATRFAWPRAQRLALAPLPQREMARLCELALAGWRRRPANLEALRERALDYAAGNPGTLLGLLRLAEEPAYWAGDSVKCHLVTVDFNLRGVAAAPRRSHAKA